MFFIEAIMPQPCEKGILLSVIADHTGDQSDRNPKNKELVIMATTFTAKLHRTDKEKVHNITLGGNKTIDVVPPPDMSEHEDASSPHHLFLASVGSCVNLIFEIALEKGHIEFSNITSDISGEYVTDEETQKSAFESISIDTTVTVPNGANETRIKKLFNMAKDNCPIGNCLLGSCVKLVSDINIEYE